MTQASTDDLAIDLGHLATALDALVIPDLSDRGRLAAKRDWMVRTIRDYLIPRTEDPAVPLTVVFAGPTGAGKSTLLNSVAGSEHSVAGPLRPTTKAPLVLSSKTRAATYTSIGGVACRVVTGRAPILDELTLVDTPDIDSTSQGHRAIAETMIDNADVVVYVTSALRYADLVPWEVLRRAHSRGAPVIHVLNRIKSTSAGALADYRGRLQMEGLGSEVVAVHEHHMNRHRQSVPLMVIQELRDRLVEVVEARHAGASNVTRSVLDTTLTEVADLLAAVSDLAARATEATSRVRAGLTVDMNRIRQTVHNDVLSRVDLEPLVGLARKRIRTRGRVRRRLPASVAIGHDLLDASLVGAVITDIRRQLLNQGLVRRGQVGEVMEGAYDAVATAVAEWHRELDASTVTGAAIDPALFAFLLARSCVEEPAPDVEAVMGLLSGSRDQSVPTTRAVQRLELNLTPAYAGVEYQVTSRIGALIASDAAIYKTRASLSAVIARSSFANA